MHLHLCNYVFFFVVFFFQAEDGIRDWSVTGVQTCALPISRDDDLRDAAGRRGCAPRGRERRARGTPRDRERPAAARGARPADPLAWHVRNRHRAARAVLPPVAATRGLAAPPPLQRPPHAPR